MCFDSKIFCSYKALTIVEVNQETFMSFIQVSYVASTCIQGTLYIKFMLLNHLPFRVLVLTS